MLMPQMMTQWVSIPRGSVGIPTNSRITRRLRTTIRNPIAALELLEQFHDLWGYLLVDRTGLLAVAFLRQPHSVQFILITCLSVSIFLYRFASLSPYLLAHLFVSLSLCVSLPVCLSVCRSVCLRQ